MKPELQKMLDGELYNANDAELIALRLHARKLFSRYNQTPCDDMEEKNRILRALLGSCGSTIDIQAPFYCDYGIHIHTGENVFINFNCTILDCARVTIGNNVFLAPNVQLYTAYHPVIATERIKGPELASPITIGDNSWLGGGVIVCPGVTIGSNTTIGAGSVVTRNVPSDVIAAGNPCRVIRKLE